MAITEWCYHCTLWMLASSSNISVKCQHVNLVSDIVLVTGLLSAQLHPVTAFCFVHLHNCWGFHHPSKSKTWISFYVSTFYFSPITDWGSQLITMQQLITSRWTIKGAFYRHHVRFNTFVFVWKALKRH